MPRAVRLSGQIADVFAHRFVLSMGSERYLADIGPKGAELVSLNVGATVELEGEQKPSEVKVSRLVLDGREYAIEWPAPKHPKDKPHPHPSFRLELSAAVKSANDAGYEVLGDPQRKPKHFELLVRKGDKMSEIHVGEDGDIRKTRPVSPTDPKWHDTIAAN